MGNTGKRTTTPSLQLSGSSPHNAGTILTNTPIAVRISIHDDTPNGTVVYSERNVATTNQFGLFTYSVGYGTVLNGSFVAIDWASGNKYMQVDFDPNGGTNYTDTLRIIIIYV